MQRKASTAWLAVGLVLAIAVVGRASHGHWMDHYHSATGTPCCAERDCDVVQARILEQTAEQALVEVNGVPVRIPIQSLHASEDAQDHWCGIFKGPVTESNTRCIFIAVGM